MPDPDGMMPDPDNCPAPYHQQVCVCCVGILLLFQAFPNDAQEPSELKCCISSCLAKKSGIKRSETAHAFLPCSTTFVPFHRLVLLVASGSWYCFFHNPPPFSLTIAFRGAMLHALTVPPASSTSDRLYSPPLNLTFWQAMAGSA